MWQPVVLIAIHVLGTDGFIGPKRACGGNSLAQLHRAICVGVVPDAVVVEHEHRDRQLLPQNARQFDVLLQSFIPVLGALGEVPFLVAVTLLISLPRSSAGIVQAPASFARAPIDRDSLSISFSDDPVCWLFE